MKSNNHMKKSNSVLSKKTVIKEIRYISSEEAKKQTKKIMREYAEALKKLADK